MDENLQTTSTVAEQTASTTTGETNLDNTQITENTSATIENNEGNVATTPSQPFLQVKFNKQDIPLTQEQALEYAQKGMNYDKVYSKYEELSNSKSLKYMERVAQANNMSIDELVDYLEVQEQERQVRDLVEQNLPEEVAKELIESRKFREQQQKQQKQIQDQKAHEAYQNMIIDEFVKAYPDIKPEQIPDEVWQSYSEGNGTLKQCYTEYENIQLKNQISILNKNLSNRDTAPINQPLSANGNGQTKTMDDFTKGVLSV